MLRFCHFTIFSSIYFFPVSIFKCLHFVVFQSYLPSPSSQYRGDCGWIRRHRDRFFVGDSMEADQSRRRRSRMRHGWPCGRPAHILRHAVVRRRHRRLLASVALHHDRVVSELGRGRRYHDLRGSFALSIHRRRRSNPHVPSAR